MAIKAVTFDFWNTLFKDSFDIGEKRQAWRIARMAEVLGEVGWSKDQAEILTAVNEASKVSTEIRLRGITDFTPEQQVEFILNSLGIEAGLEVFTLVLEVYTSAAGFFPPSLMPGAMEALQWVSSRYPIGLISNTGITPGSVLREILDNAGIMDYFQLLTFSNEVNLVKPNPQIFVLTAKNLGVEAHELLHVGDDYEADVLGANRVGGKGVWLNGDKRDSGKDAFAVVGALSDLQHVLAEEK